MGTEKKDLIYQFLIESTLMVLIGLILAVCITYAVLPMFNDVASKQMTLTSLFTPEILPLLIALPVVVGLLAGSYPAFFLSAFKPIEVLKGKLGLGSRSGSLRSVLVVFQFANHLQDTVLRRSADHLAGHDLIQGEIIRRAARRSAGDIPFGHDAR